VEETAQDQMLDSKQAAVVQVVVVRAPEVVMPQFLAKQAVQAMAQLVAAAQALSQTALLVLEPMAALVVLEAAVAVRVQTALVEAALVESAQFLFTTKEKYKCLISQ
jgi:hypothetical protein